MMERIKAELAKRVAQREDEMLYIYDLHSIRSFFGENISLQDVKPGDIITMKFVPQDMSEAGKSLRGNIFEDDPKPDVKMLHVKDIVCIDGKYFIETNGKTYSNINMKNEWIEAKEDVRIEKLKALLVGAIEEKNDWYRPRTDRLMEELGVANLVKEARITSRADKRTIYDKAIDGLGEWAQIEYDSKTQTTKVSRAFTDAQIEDLIKESRLAIKDCLNRMQYDEQKVIAEKVYELGLPVFYFRPESIDATRSYSMATDSPQEKEKKAFDKDAKTKMRFEANMRPMLPDTELRPYDIRSLKLDKTIKCDNGAKIYVTNRGIFSSYDFGEAYRDVLKENGHWCQAFESQQLANQQYASIIINGQNSLLAHVSPGTYESRYGAYLSKPGQDRYEKEVNGIKEMLKSAIESERKIIHIKSKDNYGAYNKTDIADANGMRESVRWDSIMAGDVVGLNCDTMQVIDVATDNHIRLPEDRMFAVQADEIYSVQNHYIIVTNDAVFTTMEEVADMAKDMYKEIQLGLDEVSRNQE